ncbi:hypothetical protein HZC30_02390 [Candidatus Woesearchaeota archaeon]|nr:hypothetical protein [Candidatus Woesearchaeota archaeon]
MANDKSVGKLFFYALLLVILLFGLIRVLINAGGNFFRLELLGFLVLLAMSVAGCIGYVRVWGERVLFGVFVLYLINLVLMWYVTRELSIVLLVLGVVGFISSIPRAAALPKPKAPEAGEPHSVVFDAQERKAASEAKEEPKATTKFTPGKYLASKSGNVYHEPKCDWAKKIRKARQVWFNTKEEAWEKGFKAHDCVS